MSEVSAESARLACRYCSTPIRHIGPSLLVEGQESYIHVGAARRDHLATPKES